jgi:glycosyltransferase involved in cell wall biosynthesis
MRNDMSMLALFKRIIRYSLYQFSRFRINFVYPTLFKLEIFAKKLIEPTQYCKLAIIDDYLPNILSAYRAFEFSFFLKDVENSVLFSIIENKKIMKFVPYYSITELSQFEKYKSEFINVFDINQNSVRPFFPWTKIKCNLVYIVFLNNAFRYLDYFEKQDINFVLELYPGGGFVLNDEGPGWEKLVRVVKSPRCRNVITTQKPTKKFLLEKNICEEEKISFIYGGVLPDSFENVPSKTKKFGINKNTIDICFTASKYVVAGLDKGYDLFIAMAQILLEDSDVFQFYIVGGFDQFDVPINPQFASHFHFSKFLKTEEFVTFYEDKDIFVAPCRPNILEKGAFDGFPTGTCVDAGRNELCLILSDPLDSNIIFENGVDVLLVNNDAAEIAAEIKKLAQTPEKIYELGSNGRKALKKIDIREQLNFRLSLINKYIKE